MNKLENGVQATAVVADGAVPKPNAPATNAGLVWNGSNWIAAALVNANIDPTAAIAYSKLNLAGTIVNNDIATGAAIAKSKLASLGIVDADVAAGAAIASSKISGFPISYRKTTSKTVVNSIAETDLLNGEITLAANDLGTNRVLRLRASGDWKQNSGAGANHPQFKLKLGATTIFDTGVQTAQAANSVARSAWEIEASISSLGATNSQWATLNGRITDGGSTTQRAQVLTTGEGVYTSLITDTGLLVMIGGNAAAVDGTTTQALVLSVILPTANAAVDIVLKQALVVIE